MSVEKYLSNYAEPESFAKVSHTFAKKFDTCLVVPCIGEYETFLELKKTIEASSQHCKKTVLVIVVINATPITSAEYQERNKKLFNLLSGYPNGSRAAQPRNARHDSHLDNHKTHSSVSYFAIDRFTENNRFGEKEGVGLARKIGCDIALSLTHKKIVTSQYIHTTDADAKLPLDYFEDLEPGPSLYIHSYQHLGDVDENVLKATQIYESFLDYYVRGLKFANSIYAFDTIGSTFSILDTAYATVRGFPKKNAGEDFYLFNKLRKVGEVKNSGRVITLLPRVSERVPFGTGVSTKKILKKLLEQEEITFYDPRCFLLLRDILNLKDLEKYSQLITIQKLTANLNQAKTYRKTDKDLAKHFEDYFDAFQILKLIHESTEKIFPKINFRKALDLLPQL